MTEIEIKFQIPAHQQHALNDFLQQFELNVIPLHAKYYETLSHDLARHHAAIRVRREGKQWIQMLKAKAESDLHRLEYEIHLGEHADAHLDLQQFQAIPAAQQFLERALGQNLATLSLQFETDVLRTQTIMAQGESCIELSLDSGEIRSQSQSSSLYEIEFELKQGHIFDLIELCKTWISQFDLWIDVRSKAERGHLLAEGQAVSPAKCYQAPSSRDLSSILSAFHRACLPNMAALIAGVAETTHQQALKDSLQQIQTQLDPFNDLEAGCSVQITNWRQQISQLILLEGQDFINELASCRTQLMLLEQLQTIYQVNETHLG